MNRDDLLKVNVLGVNLTLKTADDPTQLKQVIWFLNKKIDETREKHKSVDQLKLSILSSIYIVDELINLKNNQFRKLTDEQQSTESINVQEEIDRAFQRVIQVLDDTVND